CRRLAVRSPRCVRESAAADDDGVGMRGDRLRAGRVAYAEADADRKADMPSYFRESRDALGGVEMTGTGNAFERDIVDVAPRHGGDERHARDRRRRRQEKDRRESA